MGADLGTRHRGLANVAISKQPDFNMLPQMFLTLHA